jgi:hypothetical protein
MYIHIGEDLSIKVQDIIAILDKDSVNTSDWIKEFFRYHDGKVTNLSKIPFKSVVITSGRIYLSPIASGTLKKRSNQRTYIDIDKIGS